MHKAESSAAEEGLEIRPGRLFEALRDRQFLGDLVEHATACGQGVPGRLKKCPANPEQKSAMPSPISMARLRRWSGSVAS